LSAERQGRPKI